VWVVRLLNLILVTFALMLHRLIFILLASLVQERRVGVVEDLLGVGSDLPQHVDVLLGTAICLLIRVHRWLRVNLLDYLLLLLLLGLFLLHHFLLLLLGDELSV
jgi:hypothetical protein